MLWGCGVCGATRSKELCGALWVVWGAVWPVVLYGVYGVCGDRWGSTGSVRPDGLYGTLGGSTGRRALWGLRDSTGRWGSMRFALCPRGPRPHLRPLHLQLLPELRPAQRCGHPDGGAAGGAARALRREPIAVLQSRASRRHRARGGRRAAGTARHGDGRGGGGVGWAGTGDGGGGRPRRGGGGRRGTRGDGRRGAARWDAGTAAGTSAGVCGVGWLRGARRWGRGAAAPRGWGARWGGPTW